jgi:hypothetical protein
MGMFSSNSVQKITPGASVLYTTSACEGFLDNTRPRAQTIVPLRCL